MNIMYSKILVLLVILASAFCDNEITDKNVQTNCTVYAGECITVISCHYALKLIENNDFKKVKSLLPCGFDGLRPKVCCPKVDGSISYKDFEETATNRPRPLTTLKPEITSRFAPIIIEQRDTINEQRDTIIEQRDTKFPDKSMCGIYSAVSDRIVGGSVTQIDEHPWLARVRYKIGGQNIFGCSASLITDRYLLTAAHCVKRYKPKSIRLGEWNIDEEVDCHNDICNNKTIDVNISSITIHPSFSSISVENDIALIQLEETVQFTEFIQPICLPISKYIALQDYSSDSVYVTAGWGLTEFESESVVKRKVQLNAAPFEVCRDRYKLNAESEPNVICAGGIKGKDSCKGDSGGPLVKLVSENYEINWYLYGITSFGSPNCGTEGVPGIYTRVSAYMEWIREVIK